MSKVDKSIEILGAWLGNLKEQASMETLTAFLNKVIELRLATFEECKAFRDGVKNEKISTLFKLWQHGQEYDE